MFKVLGQVEISKSSSRRITFIATREVLDRDGELVISSGLDVSDYLKNPVMCSQHDTKKTAVATVENLRLTFGVDAKPQWVGEAAFPDRPASNEALAGVQAGLLTGVSIGFQVEESEGPRLPGQTGRTYTKTRLIEISLVTISSCATCLVNHKSCECTTASIAAEAGRQAQQSVNAALEKNRKSAYAKDEALFISGDTTFALADDELVTVVDKDFAEWTPHAEQTLRNAVALSLGKGVAKIAAQTVQDQIDYHRGRVR